MAKYSGTFPKTQVGKRKYLKKGDKGTQVIRVQRFLNWAIDANLVVDGHFGPATRTAVKKFQKKVGLKANGHFGSGTLKAAKNYDKPTPKKEGTYTGAFPNITVKTAVIVNNGKKLVAKADEYCWPKGTATKKWKYSTGSALKAYKKALKKYMGYKSKITRSDCGYFVSTCVRAAGIDKTFNALKWKNKIKSCWKVAHKGKKIKQSTLKPGDIIRYKKKTKRPSGAYEQHVMMYYGNGYVAEAGRQVRFPIIRKDTKRYNGSNINHSTIQVLRAKDTKETGTRKYLKKGDTGTEIKKAQKFFNWLYGANTLVVNGTFDAAMEKVVKKFQKEKGITVNGHIDSTTLSKMKSSVK